MINYKWNFNLSKNVKFIPPVFFIHFMTFYIFPSLPLEIILPNLIYTNSRLQIVFREKPYGNLIFKIILWYWKATIVNYNHLLTFTNRWAQISGVNYTNMFSNIITFWFGCICEQKVRKWNAINYLQRIVHVQGCRLQYVVKINKCSLV